MALCAYVLAYGSMSEAVVSVRIEIDRSLEAVMDAAENARAALTKLQEDGHSESCACKLCFAARRILSACKRLAFDAAKNTKGKRTKR